MPLRRLRSRRIVAFLHFCILAFLLSAEAQQKLTLVGLRPQQVEAKIGAPDEKDVLADSDEAYWTYKTPHGVLTVHFQNGLVVSFTPEAFPLEKIVNSDKENGRHICDCSDVVLH